MKNVNDNGINKIGLVCKISNKKIKDGDHIILFEEDAYLTLKSDKKSFALLKQQGFINKGEIIIFLVKIKEKDIELINCIDRCYNCSQMKKFYEKINSINYKLWKVIKPDIHTYNLKENDVFRLGNIKIILREFIVINNAYNPNDKANKEGDYNNDINQKGKDINDNPKRENSNSRSVTQSENYKIISDKRPFTILLESNPGKICDICKKSYQKEDDPLVQFCECEKYEHFKCKKQKMYNDGNFFGNTDDYVRKMKTDCPDCKKFVHSNFIIKEGNKYKLFELLSLRMENRSYLKFETFDFLDKDKKYIKYNIYVELNEQYNYQNNISISLEGEQPTFNKKNGETIIKIESEEDKTSHQININVDLKEKKLVLINNSNKNDILVLENNIKVNSNDRLLLESGDLKIEPNLINREIFDIIKEQMENNPEKIEIRTNF